MSARLIALPHKTNLESRIVALGDEPSINNKAVHLDQHTVDYTESLNVVISNNAIKIA